MAAKISRSNTTCFFLCSYLKTLVYKISPKDILELKNVEELPRKRGRKFDKNLKKRLISLFTE